MEKYNEEQFRQKLTTKWLGKETVYVDTVNSTNDYAKNKAKNGAKHGLLIVADNQTKGKGSKGRVWVSPPKTGIWMSFILRPNASIYQARELSLMLSYCIAKTLRETYNIPAMIKWPNDIVLNRKKIAGILIEAEINKENVEYLVCGIGINVNMTQFISELKNIATSLCIECGHLFSRTELLANILNRIEKEYDEYLKVNSLSDICAAYNEMLIHRETEIKIIKGKDVMKVTSIGINECGELLVCHEDGKIQTISAGEVSISGIYK